MDEIKVSKKVESKILKLLTVAEEALYEIRNILKKVENKKINVKLIEEKSLPSLSNSKASKGMGVNDKDKRSLRFEKYHIT